MLTIYDVDRLAARLKSDGTPGPEIVRQLAEACLGWPYVFGAAGEMCTVSNRQQFAGYHPEYREKIYGACQTLLGGGSCGSCKWDNCLIFDCRGFTRWLLKQAGIPLAGGGATSQWNTAANWAYKGTIDKIPTGLVCCLFKQKGNKMSHTGMYLGEGYIIHCSKTVKRDILPGTPRWTHFGIPAGLYTTEELREVGIDVTQAQNTPTLRRGDSGDSVKEMQELLNELGWHLEPDGKFGPATETAVKAFQKAVGLKEDGICGPKTWDVLRGAASEGDDDSPPGKDEGYVTLTLPRDVANALFEALGAQI